MSAAATLPWTPLAALKRMGADEVYIVYRRSEKELPARLEEIHHAKEEGVVFKFLTAPLEVLSDENFNVTGLKCQQMELGEPDASGRRRPIPVEGSDFVLDLDCVIAAIGTKARTTDPSHHGSGYQPQGLHRG